MCADSPFSPRSWTASNLRLIVLYRTNHNVMEHAKHDFSWTHCVRLDAVKMRTLKLCWFSQNIFIPNFTSFDKRDKRFCPQIVVGRTYHHMSVKEYKVRDKRKVFGKFKKLLDKIFHNVQFKIVVFACAYSTSSIRDCCIS